MTLERRVTLECYLVREDGEYFELGSHHLWGYAFHTFPGPADLSVRLTPADAELLAIRLFEPVYALSRERCARIADNIIAWAQGKSFRYVNELDPEIEPGIRPDPITGTWAQA
jgi:hypothetical protein